MDYKIKTATGLVKLYMKMCGFKGWTSFWKTIYLMPGYETNERLIKHEKCHLEQIQSDGIFMFSILYVYWLWRHGYWNNPYEVEAREAELK